MENPFNTSARSLLTLAALNLVAFTSYAMPGDLDPSFSSGPLLGVSSAIVVALQNDGKAVVGGGFSSIAGSSRNGIARLNTDGSVDGSFLNGLSGANNAVYCVGIQGNSQILAGGNFTLFNGSSRSRIARLNSNGTVDSSFLNGLSGANDSVECLAIQGDGKILIGGYFSAVNGTGRNLIARLNSDGSLDNSFLNGQGGANNGVFAIAMQPDGKILLGGAFTTLNGTSRNYVGRLNSDGTLDNTFLNGLSGADGGVNAIALQPDGRVIIGGSFNSINGTNRNFIARLNSDGSLDTSFLNGLSGADSYVYSLALQGNGQVVVGGDFGSLNDAPRNGVGRLNSDGSLDQLFGYHLAGADDFVRSLALQSDGRIMMGGAFGAVNGTTRNQIAQLLVSYDPPRIDSPRIQFGLFIFDVLGAPGQQYLIQASSDLKTWTPLTTVVMGNAPTPFSDPQTSFFGKRFYQLLKQ